MTEYLSVQLYSLATHTHSAKREGCSPAEVRHAVTSRSKSRVKLSFLEFRILMASSQYLAADTRLIAIAAPDSLFV